ncbi:MAG TPA: efflux RND transporter periplasmic adaptor subunit [Candidatus Binataceae bacterium]|nr:efflux RND transporter periplasmic adaptor subunit [Candidatus Binataceae bacterium]
MLETQDRAPAKAGAGFFLGWAGAVIVVLAALGGLVLARGIRIGQQTDALQHQEDLGPLVMVAPVERAPMKRTITYPGDIHGFFESAIYPKVAGYVKSMLVDKGMRVRRGQLLAVIVSPELDQQVADALASYQIAKITDDRYQKLLGQQIVPQETADASHATMLSDRARWESLRAEQDYERVLAPFDGVVTARNLDPGALVAMATAQAGAVPIVAMATLKPVRVYLNMPQDDAAFVRDGDAAQVTVTQFPNRSFSGTVTRHPEALMNSSRTMLVEVDLPNDDQSLLPGMYAHLEISLTGNSGAPLVPDDSLVFQGGSVFVPVVAARHVHLVKVKLGLDDGIKSEVVQGLTGNEMVAINLGQVARDGQLVRTAEEPGR